MKKLILITMLLAALVGCQNDDANFFEEKSRQNNLLQIEETFPKPNVKILSSEVIRMKKRSENEFPYLTVAEVGTPNGQLPTLTEYTPYTTMDFFFETEVGSTVQDWRNSSIEKKVLTEGLIDYRGAAEDNFAYLMEITSGYNQSTVEITSEIDLGTYQIIAVVYYWDFEESDWVMVSREVNSLDTSTNSNITSFVFEGDERDRIYTIVSRLRVKSTAPDSNTSPYETLLDIHSNPILIEGTGDTYIPTTKSVNPFINPSTSVQSIFDYVSSEINYETELGDFTTYDKLTKDRIISTKGIYSLDILGNRPTPFSNEIRISNRANQANIDVEFFIQEAGEFCNCFAETYIYNIDENQNLELIQSDTSTFNKSDRYRYSYKIDDNDRNQKFHVVTRIVNQQSDAMVRTQSGTIFIEGI